MIGIRSRDSPMTGDKGETMSATRISEADARMTVRQVEFACPADMAAQWNPRKPEFSRIFRRLTPRGLRITLPGDNPRQLREQAVARVCAQLFARDHSPLRFDTKRLDAADPIPLS
ncbi:hypothetical protein [Panacagrimonas sp.]|uniref:hypothetical protein n=1 Tax=Panacagrimonas sp. TaxID=2480088 RepID=UPI003B52E76F